MSRPGRRRRKSTTVSAPGSEGPAARSPPGLCPTSEPSPPDPLPAAPRAGCTNLRGRTLCPGRKREPAGGGRSWLELGFPGRGQAEHAAAAAAGLPPPGPRAGLGDRPVPPPGAALGCAPVWAPPPALRVCCWPPRFPGGAWRVLGLTCGSEACNSPEAPGSLGEARPLSA